MVRAAIGKDQAQRLCHLIHPGFRAQKVDLWAVAFKLKRHVSILYLLTSIGRSMAT